MDRNGHVTRVMRRRRFLSVSSVMRVFFTVTLELLFLRVFRSPPRKACLAFNEGMSVHV